MVAYFAYDWKTSDQLQVSMDTSCSRMLIPSKFSKCSYILGLSKEREREHWQACLVVHFPDSVVQHITDEIVKGIIEGISVIL